MNTINFNNNISEIFKSIELKEFSKAKRLISNLGDNINLEIKYNLEGLIYLRTDDYKSSIATFKKAIDINPKYLSAYVNLALAYEKLNDITNAEKYLYLALELNLQSDAIHNSLGHILFKQNKIKESIIHFEKAVNLNAGNYKAYFNLGNAFDAMGDYQKSIKFFKKTIEINKNLPDVHFHLAESFKKNNNCEEALSNYKISLKEKLTWLRREKINAKILECFLILKKKKEYLNAVIQLTKENTNNRRIAATTTYIAHQFNVKNDYPFCKNPLDFIYKGTLMKYFENYNNFLELIYDEITNQNFQWEPSSKTTRKGFGTVGNLSEKKLPFMSQLEKYILEELSKFYNIHKNKKDTFISNWPNQFQFISWSNRLKKEGYNITHIHPGGWVSGVFYLKIPKNKKNDEAGIEFSLHGDNYYIVNNNIPTKTLHPEVGEIVLFPSSLFHRTIPFESDEERVCIAFDLCKI